MDVLTHGLAGASIGVLASRWMGDGSIQPEFLASTTIAALLPDLDFIFAIANRPLLAWRWHRVLLHNVFVIPLLALLSALGVHLCFGGVSVGSLLWWNVVALFSHLLLDLLTSFRTAVLFPLSDRRFAFGTHFLTDPIIGVLCALSLVPAWNLWSLVVLASYLLLAVGLKSRALRVAERQQFTLGLGPGPIHLRPRVFAPWRWLAIVEQESHYIFFNVTPIGADSPQETSRGLETHAAKLAGRNELLRCFLSLADFPRFEDTQRDDSPAIVVEDIQWWWKLPYRPMAMSAVLDAEGNPNGVRESSKFSTSPVG